jgi:membrane protein implicated in regulation of membrane protease activity
MSHRLRGAVIALLAGLSLGALMFFPRVLSIGVSLGAVLVLVFAAGVLDIFGAWKIERRRETAPERPRFDPSDQPGWLRLIAAFDVRLLWTGLALIAAAACRVSVIGTLGAAAPWSGPLLAGLGLATIGVARLVRRKRPFDGRFHQG